MTRNGYAKYVSKCVRMQSDLILSTCQPAWHTSQTGEGMPLNHDCRYSDHRTPPWVENQYKRTAQYWEILVWKFAFVVIFEVSPVQSSKWGPWSQTWGRSLAEHDRSPDDPDPLDHPRRAKVNPREDPPGQQAHQRDHYPAGAETATHRAESSRLSHLSLGQGLQCGRGRAPTAPSVLRRGRRRQHASTRKSSRRQALAHSQRREKFLPSAPKRRKLPMGGILECIFESGFPVQLLRVPNFLAH